ncbi:MAG TPA: biotin transporter BioY [Terriglobia bacterium]|nr:biotin transporter BioY [Terriglobia bacterium]
MVRADSNLLADYLIQERRIALDISWVVGFTLLTAVMAQIRFQFPYTTVPLTGQTFAVLLSGAVLGSRRGFASQVLYVTAGASGLPVFAGGAFSAAYLLGPTGGYLLSFPVAAYLIGWLVERGASRHTWRLALSLMLCDSIILVSGAFWLHYLFNFSYRQAALLGFYPFLIGDTLKIVLVGLTLPGILNRVKRIDPAESPNRT